MLSGLAILVLFLSGCSLIEQGQFNLHAQAGSEHFGKNELAKAQKEYETALSIAERQDQNSLNNATTLNDLSDVNFKLKLPDKCKPLYERALEISEALLRKNTEQTNGDAGGSAKQVKEDTLEKIRAQLIRSALGLGSVYRGMGQYATADAMYKKAFAAQEQ